MTKFDNLKQANVDSKNQDVDPLQEFKSNRKSSRRQGEVLNGFVILIGVFGFVTTFFLPPDLVYNRSSLKDSFSNKSNSSQYASSSLVQNIAEVPAQEAIKSESNFHLNGILEAEEIVDLYFDGFHATDEVKYFVDFGNGEKRKINDFSTFYKYPNSGNFLIKVVAQYEGKQKMVFEKKVYIDEAIIVQSDAFVDMN